MVLLFPGVALVSCWCSAGILGCILRLFWGVPLFRRCSVFRRSWFYSMRTYGKPSLPYVQNQCALFIILCSVLIALCGFLFDYVFFSWGYIFILFGFVFLPFGYTLRRLGFALLSYFCLSVMSSFYLGLGSFHSVMGSLNMLSLFGYALI